VDGWNTAATAASAGGADFGRVFRDTGIERSPSALRRDTGI
jgi:hypothetical protein